MGLKVPLSLCNTNRISSERPTTPGRKNSEISSKKIKFLFHLKMFQTALTPRWKKNVSIWSTECCQITMIWTLTGQSVPQLSGTPDGEKKIISSNFKFYLKNNHCKWTENVQETLCIYIRKIKSNAIKIFSIIAWRSTKIGTFLYIMMWLKVG